MPQYFANSIIAVGMGVLLVFGIHRALIRTGAFSEVPASAVPALLRTLLRHSFVIAIITITLGFGLRYYEVFRTTPSPEKANSYWTARILDLDKREEVIQGLLIATREAINSLAKQAADPGRKANADTALLGLEKGDAHLAVTFFANLSADREAAGNRANQSAQDAKQHRDALLNLRGGQLAAEITRAIQTLQNMQHTEDAPEGLDEALAQLAIGNTRQAEGIFILIYENKSSQGKVAFKQAAEAARYLGALESLYDTRKAITTLTKSTNLDPDNAEGWLLLGLLQLDSGDLEAASEALSMAHELGDPTPIPYDVTTAGVVHKLNQRNSANIDSSLPANALDTARLISDTRLRDSAIGGIVKAFSIGRNPELAKKAAGEISDSWERSHSLVTVAKAFALLGKTEDARQIIMYLEPHYQDECIAEIGKYYIGVGQLDNAFAIVRELLDKNSYHARILLRTIAKSGDKEFYRALEFLKTREGASDRTSVLYLIATDLIKSGNIKSAVVALHEAITEIRSIQSKSLRLHRLASVAGALIAAGDNNQATLVLGSIHEEGAMPRDPQLLIDVAAASIVVGKSQEATDLLESLRSKELFISLRMLNTIAVSFIRNGDIASALAIAHAISPEAKIIQQPNFTSDISALSVEIDVLGYHVNKYMDYQGNKYMDFAYIDIRNRDFILDRINKDINKEKADILENVSVALGMAGHLESALEIAKRLEEFGRSPDSAIGRVADECAKHGDFVSAKSAAKAASNPSAVLMKVGLRQFRMHARDEAYSTFSEALGIVDQLGVSSPKATKFLEVAQVFSCVPDNPRAQAVLDRAMKALEEDKEFNLRPWTMLDVAETFAAVGASEAALGALLRLRDRILKGQNYIGFFFSERVVDALEKCGFGEAAYPLLESEYKRDEIDAERPNSQDIALAMFRAGNFARSVEMVKKQKVASDRVYGLVALAEGAHERANSKQVGECLGEAWREMRGVKDRATQSELISAIAIAQAKTSSMFVADDSRKESAREICARFED